MINLDHTGDGVALIEIANPPANALGRAAREAFHKALDHIAARDDIRAVVITGSSGTFCSGDDLKEQRILQEDGLAARQQQLGEFGRLIERIASLPIPAIAAVNGHCLGGGLELALACDLRIGADSARFVCAGVNVGLMASAYRLPRLIGVARAKHMLLTGLPITATTAEAFGLITLRIPDERLRDEALALAQRIASRAPLSVAAARELADRAVDLTPEEAATHSSKVLNQLLASQDHAEALQAFREKRTPHFKGR
jgi:enoyl-CoA hydratase/carnithine racemase